VTVPTTSASERGGSALTTGICDTPYSRRIDMADLTDSAGWTCTRGGIVDAPSPRDLATSRSSTVSPALPVARRNPWSAIHPSSYSFER
jgi:hypothetical protein